MHGRGYLLIFNKISNLYTRIIAVHHRHVDVQKHQSVLAIAILFLENFLKSLGSVDCTVHFEFVGFQHQRKCVDVEFIVVDYQNLGTTLLLFKCVWEKTVSHISGIFNDILWTDLSWQNHTRVLDVWPLNEGLR